MFVRVKNINRGQNNFNSYFSVFKYVLTKYVFMLQNK